MDRKLRQVTATPLAELSTDAGPLPARRIRQLGEAGIKELLRAGEVEFAVAGGSPRLECGSGGRALRLLEDRASARGRRLRHPPGDAALDAAGA